MALSNEDWDYFVKDKVPEKEIEHDLEKLLDESKEYRIDREISNLVDKGTPEREIRRKLNYEIRKEFRHKGKEEVDKLVELKKLHARILREKKQLSKKKKVIHKQTQRAKSTREYFERLYKQIYICWRNDDIYLPPTRLQEIAEKEYNMQKISEFIKFVVRDWLIKEGKLPKEAMDFYIKDQRERQILANQGKFKKELKQIPTYEKYKYLKPLSEETRKYIIDKVNNGEVNLYFSCLSVLSHRLNKNDYLQDMDTEYKYYLSRKNLNKEDMKYIKELFELCYMTFTQRNPNRVEPTSL